MPAIGMIIQYRYMTGSATERIFLAALPWLLFTALGLLTVVSTEYEATTNSMNQAYFIAPIYSVVLGVIVLVAQLAYGNFRNESKH